MLTWRRQCGASTATYARVRTFAVEFKGPIQQTDAGSGPCHLGKTQICSGGFAGVINWGLHPSTVAAVIQTQMQSTEHAGTIPFTFIAVSIHACSYIGA